MPRRYPRSIIVTLCVTLALALAATVLTNARESASDRRGLTHATPTSASFYL